MLDQAARRLAAAVNLARRGRFADAADQAEAAIEAAPLLAGIDQLRQQYLEQSRQAQSLLEELHAALEKEQWTDVLRCSDRLLELAPEHRIAREARQRAWGRVGARTREGPTPPAV
jgi:regulator of sirC expression with transglutaminase-like and TPR domain